MFPAAFPNAALMIGASFGILATKNRVTFGKGNVYCGIITLAVYNMALLSLTPYPFLGYLLSALVAVLTYSMMTVR